MSMTISTWRRNPLIPFINGLEIIPDCFDCVGLSKATVGRSILSSLTTKFEVNQKFGFHKLSAGVSQHTSLALEPTYTKLAGGL